MSRQNFKSSDEKITCLVQLDKRVEGFNVHTAEPDLQILQFFKVEYIYHG